MKLIAILIAIESGGDPAALNMKENVAGVLQIRPIMVKEVNRISKLNGSKDIFTLGERFSRGLSVQMCNIFLDHQEKRYIKKHGRKPSDLELALSWQSGGIFNKPCEKYKKKLIKKGVK